VTGFCLALCRVSGWGVCQNFRGQHGDAALVVEDRPGTGGGVDCCWFMKNFRS
jgi:hypothetical protein